MTDKKQMTPDDMYERLQEIIDGVAMEGGVLVTVGDKGTMVVTTNMSGIDLVNSAVSCMYQAFKTVTIGRDEPLDKDDIGFALHAFEETLRPLIDELLEGKGEEENDD